MLLWIGFAILTAGVIIALVRPLLRPAEAMSQSAAADVEVYRDQIRAIDAEAEQGLIEANEAEAARAELARRLIRAADSVDGASAPPADTQVPRTRERTLLYGASALIPVLSIGVYLAVGSPNLPGTAYGERIAGSHNGRSITELVGLVEARLKANPGDAQGWEVIAPVYLKQRRFNDAARAYANSLRLNGETPDRIAGFAEALVMANNGLIVPDARKAYERLRTIAPDEPEPKFWLAIAKEQDGDIAGSIADLEVMLKEAPADAPWKEMVEGRLGELRTALTRGAAATAPPATVAGAPAGAPATTDDAKAPAVAADRSRGPSAADVAAVEQLTPEQRSAFIQQMVDGLAARLAKDGKDLDGWKKLARAYKVMGREADAARAIADARRAFDGDTAALEAIDVLAKDLGIGS